MPAFSARKQFFFDLARRRIRPRFAGATSKHVAGSSAQSYRQDLDCWRGSRRAHSPKTSIRTFEQKGVDMRIGIDVATLALKKIVERIILFSGDTDMIPALKLRDAKDSKFYVVKLDLVAAQTQPHRRQRWRPPSHTSGLNLWPSLI